VIDRTTAFVSWSIVLATAATHAASPDGVRATRADPTPIDAVASDTIGLAATASAPGARGYVRLAHAPSPFTVAVGVDGHLIYDLAIETTGLLDPAPLGGKVYVAWVASRALDR
jgi:hypothetical protein